MYPDRDLIRKLPYELFVVRCAVTMHVTKFPRFTFSVHVNVLRYVCDASYVVMSHQNGSFFVMKLFLLVFFVLVSQFNDKYMKKNIVV